eukprot:5490606-Pyramimonas_sp.AAC.1
MARLFSALGASPEIIKLAPRVCAELRGYCRKFSRPLHRPAFRAHLATRFHERVQGDIFFLWGQVWPILVDEHIRRKTTGELGSQTGV